jgi:uncharacterized membrane protein
MSHPANAGCPECKRRMVVKAHCSHSASVFNNGDAMLPDPLHPAIVHFPLVLAFLLPISAVIAVWTIRKGSRATRAWLVPLSIAAALSLSSWVSVETGETQDERVEQVVPEQPLDTHEEAAEQFMTASIVVLLITAAGMVKGKAGGVARYASLAFAIALVGGAAYVGHTGGQLVYEHGAASAYATAAPSGMARSDVSTGDSDE